MKYSKNELLAMAKRANGEVEIYQFRDRSRRIHTDFVKCVWFDDEYVENIEELAFDENGDIECEAILMDEEDYMGTIAADSSYLWNWCNEEGDLILVVILPEWYGHGRD